MNYESLNEAILSAPITSARITGVDGGVWGMKPTEAKKIIFYADKKADITLSNNGAASLRVTDDVAAVTKHITLTAAREADAFVSLQQAIRDEKLKGGVTKDTKFTFVHRLQILDADGKNVYVNNAYKGYPAYLKAVRQAPAEGDARNQAIQAASDALRATEVKDECKGKEKFYQYMPVFTVSN